MPLLRDGSYLSLMQATTYGDHLEEAKAVFNEAKSRKLDDAHMHDLRYLIAFLQHDDSSMQQETSWLNQHGQEKYALWRELEVKAYQGQFSDARRLLRDYNEQAVTGIVRGQLPSTQLSSHWKRLKPEIPQPPPDW